MGDGDEDDRPTSIGHLLMQVMGDDEASPNASTGSDDSEHAAGGSRREPGGSGGRRGGTRRRQHRGRYPRHLRQLRIDELIGLLLQIHGVTDEVRLRCVHIFWRQIVERRIGANTVPDSITDGVLKVFVRSSSWMHEVRFHKSTMVEQINGWIHAQRRWLGPSSFLHDIRFVLGTPREPLVDPDQLRRLADQTRRRRPPPPRDPPDGGATGEDRSAILLATANIEDFELRRIIEDVRTRWNR